MTDTRPTIDKLLYTPLEAAHALGISRSTLYELLARGAIDSVRIGASRRIPADCLRRYVASLTDDPRPASTVPTSS
jgi:excisionase family DNA binding protein